MDVDSRNSATAERRAICRQCEYKQLLTCTKCGCIVAVKTASPGAHCPIGKW